MALTISTMYISRTFSRISELFEVHQASPKNVRLLAKGLNPDEGGAEMVIFETPSGGSVFSAGSINYAASLPVDDFVSRITAKVLRRFLT